jgi:hypothetical protein
MHTDETRTRRVLPKLDTSNLSEIGAQNAVDFYRQAKQLPFMQALLSQMGNKVDTITFDQLPEHSWGLSIIHSDSGRVILDERLVDPDKKRDPNDSGERSYSGLFGGTVNTRTDQTAHHLTKRTQSDGLLDFTQVLADEASAFAGNADSQQSEKASMLVGALAKQKMKNHLSRASSDNNEYRDAKANWLKENQVSSLGEVINTFNYYKRKPSDTVDPVVNNLLQSGAISQTEANYLRDDIGIDS